jgi:hypothetical protein
VRVVVAIASSVVIAWVLISCSSAREAPADPAIDLPPRDEGDTGNNNTPPIKEPLDDGSNNNADGNNVQGDAGVDAARPLIVFVTSLTTTGNAGGLAGADIKCNDHARNAGLSGTWVAWLSAQNGPHAIDRVTSAGPWHLRSGEMVAANKAGLTSGALLHAIDRDEKGLAIAAGRVWTGSGINGRYNDNDCDRWTTGNEGRVGNSGAMNQGWTTTGVDGCNNTGRLYCFER